jgi:hypothetical protein
MKINYFIPILAAGLLLPGCVTETPLSVSERTLLVYMAADNNLNDFSFHNISSMLKGSGENILKGCNLLVYQDSEDELPGLYRVRKGQSGSMESLRIRSYPDRNSASVEVMKSVLAEVFDNPLYAAKSHALLLWSHGTAWLPGDAKNYLRSYGEDDGRYMEIDSLQEALRGRQFDYIIFDDCYMANIEVVYTLRDNAKYILASPTEVLAPGLPYQHIMQHLFSKEPLEDALIKICEAFYTYYNEQQAGEMYPKSASTALVKTAGLPALADVCREILAGRMEAAFSLTRTEIQLLEYLNNTYHALYDFSDFMSKMTVSTGQYNRFKQALDDVVVFKKTTDKAYYAARQGEVTIDKTRFCGVTSYLPQRNLDKLNTWYKQLDWYKAVYE